MNTLKLLVLVTVANLAGLVPASAADLGNSAPASKPLHLTGSGWPRPVGYFDGRVGDKDFPTNGVFPGDFAADPFHAAIGAGGLFGSTSRIDRDPCARHRSSYDQALYNLFR